MLRLLLLLGISAFPAFAADWPTLHGPARDGHSTERGLNWKWKPQGPATAWKSEVGAGLAGPAVADGTVYLFHRIDRDDVLTAWNAETGKELWKYAKPTKFVDDYAVGDGPRCTPLIHGGTVFVYAADGQLHAVAAKSGKEIWSRNLFKEYAAPKGYFGVGAGPAVVDDKLIVNVGAKGACVVALDLATGKELWKTGNDAASYSSITSTQINGTPHVVAFTRAGLLVLDAKNGTVKFRKDWRSRLDASVNASTPIIWNDQVFLTASYGTGAALLKLKGEEPEEIWTGDKSMSCQFNTPVRIGDHLYGLHGRQEGRSAELRCVEWSTGKVLWSQERFGLAHVIAVDGGLLAITEGGELIRFEASPKAYSEVARATVADGTVRAAAALADGRLYLRNEKMLFCISLKP